MTNREQELQLRIEGLEGENLALRSHLENVRDQCFHKDEKIANLRAAHDGLINSFARKAAYDPPPPIVVQCTKLNGRCLMEFMGSRHLEGQVKC